MGLRDVSRRTMSGWDEESGIRGCVMVFVGVAVPITRSRSRIRDYCNIWHISCSATEVKILLNACLQAIEQPLTSIKMSSTFALKYQNFHSFLIGFNEGPFTQVRVRLIGQRLDGRVIHCVLLMGRSGRVLGLVVEMSRRGLLCLHTNIIIVSYAHELTSDKMCFPSVYRVCGHRTLACSTQGEI
jgi:hypothetical protein